MIENIDDNIGRLMNRLEQWKLYENTVLIFMSDNGGRNEIPKAPEIVEHRNAPLRDGKHSFYEGGIRVPFAAQWPGHIPAGETCTHPIMGFDVTATSLAEADVGTAAAAGA